VVVRYCVGTQEIDKRRVFNRFPLHLQNWSLLT